MTTIRSTSRWRLAAQEAIKSAIASLPPECDRSEVKNAIDQAYPFGCREYYPYKVWLDERRKWFYDLGILEKKPDKRGRKSRKPVVKQDIVPPGQLSLF